MNTREMTQRRLEKFVVKSLGTGSVTTTENSGFGVPKYIIPMLEVGGEYYLELYRFNDIAGIMTEDGEYLFHRTDDYFKITLDRYIEESHRRQKRNYLENKDDWEQRTIALPERYKARLLRFINDPDKGAEFKMQGMGWGYELIICELAVLYEQSNGVDSKAVMDLANKYGTSGNQHDVAKAWAANPEAKI